MAQVEEENILIAERVPPGDKSWMSCSNYRLEPLDGKLYAIKTFEVPEEEPMKYDLYGEY